MEAKNKKIFTAEAQRTQRVLSNQLALVKNFENSESLNEHNERAWKTSLTELAKITEVILSPADAGGKKK